MLWCDFHRALKSVDDKFRVSNNEANKHSHYNELELIGVYYDDQHICGTTYMDGINEYDLYDQHGILIQQGLRNVAVKILKGVRITRKLWDKDQIIFPIDKYELCEALGINPDYLHKPATRKINSEYIQPE